MARNAVETLTFTVDVLDGFAGFGEIEHVAPAGKPVQLSVTGCENPPNAVSARL